MKRFLLLTTVIYTIAAGNANGQEYIEPQWKFHFAFEDATGAKDTLWFVLDSAATFWNSWVPPFTNGWDPQFGETPVELDEGAFNVWTYNYEEPYNPNPPKFKLVAFPISFHPSVSIYANNYTLPITLSWDTTLFDSPVLQATALGPVCNPILDNEWFFFNSNAGWLHHAFSMLFNTEIVLPEFEWGSQDHFPIGASFDRTHECSLLSIEGTHIDEHLMLYPNPCVDFLAFSTDLTFDIIQVYDLQGKVVLRHGKTGMTGTIEEIRMDVRVLPPGMYLLQATASDGRIGVKKFVKSH